jgi:hypothetical protein
MYEPVIAVILSNMNVGGKNKIILFYSILWLKNFLKMSYWNSPVQREQWRNFFYFHE